MITKTFSFVLSVKTVAYSSRATGLHRGLQRFSPVIGVTSLEAFKPVNKQTLGKIERATLPKSSEVTGTTVNGG